MKGSELGNNYITFERTDQYIVHRTYIDTFSAVAVLYKKPYINTWAFIANNVRLRERHVTPRLINKSQSNGKNASLILMHFEQFYNRNKV